MHTILVIDDEPKNIFLLEGYLEQLPEEYKIMTATSVEEGLEILEHPEYDIQAILLDRMMPELSGIDFLERFKKNKAHETIPVIMQTAANSFQQVAEGISAGVYYYLAKPFDAQVLGTVVSSAIKNYKKHSVLVSELESYKRTSQLLITATLSCQNYEDIYSLSVYIASFYPEPKKVLIGIEELLLNAYEHGNLGITYDEKTILNQKGTWEEEIRYRATLPENLNKCIQVEFFREIDHIKLVIQDEGSGFDWHTYLETQSEQAPNNHGMGIALAQKLCFDSIEYQGSGNQVTAILKV